MPKSALRCKKSPAVKLAVTVSTTELEQHIQDWLFDCQFRQHTPQTIETRRIVTSRLLWFLKDVGQEECGTPQLRQFFAYLTNGHQEPRGRWGKPHLNAP